MLLNEMLQNEAALKRYYFVTFATLKRYSALYLIIKIPEENFFSKLYLITFPIFPTNFH